MFSFVGDTILDPFLGSGTTSLAAMNLHRSSTGYEINEGFLPIIEKRVALAQGNTAQNSTLDVVRQAEQKLHIEKKIRKLPYIFKDPTNLDKKVDPKRFKFGSRIDYLSDDKESYFRVREIMSPEILILDDGLRIRLLGNKTIPKKTGQAVQFLGDKTRGQKVFMKFDKRRYDKKQNLLCYLYLKNRTFLNAHLIKTGLTDVDTSLDYRHKTRFLGYRNQATKY